MRAPAVFFFLVLAVSVGSASAIEAFFANLFSIDVSTQFGDCELSCASLSMLKAWTVPDSNCCKVSHVIQSKNARQCLVNRRPFLGMAVAPASYASRGSIDCGGSCDYSGNSGTYPTVAFAVFGYEKVNMNYLRAQCNELVTVNAVLCKELEQFCDEKKMAARGAVVSVSPMINFAGNSDTFFFDYNFNANSALGWNFTVRPGTVFPDNNQTEVNVDYSSYSNVTTLFSGKTRDLVVENKGVFEKFAQSFDTNIVSASDESEFVALFPDGDSCVIQGCADSAGVSICRLEDAIEVIGLDGTNCNLIFPNFINDKNETINSIKNIQTTLLGSDSSSKVELSSFLF